MITMNKIIIRRGKIADAQNFSKLILLSAPVYYSSFYGSCAERIIKNLFVETKNIFSFEHSYFIGTDDKVFGMALGYDFKQKSREESHTVVLLVKCLKLNFILKIFNFLKTRNAGKIVGGEYYLNTIALYPQFRGSGLGKKLLLTIEQEAKEKGDKKIVLNVEQDNIGAIKFYKNLGYKLGEKVFNFNIGKKSFKFLRMYKSL